MSDDNLEQILQAMALNDFEQASRFPEGPSNIVKQYRKEVENSYRNPKYMHDNINNFMIDSVRYHRMHCEQDMNVSLDWMHLETIEYLARLINGYPPQERGLQENWRRGSPAQPYIGEAQAQDEDDGN